MHRGLKVENKERKDNKLRRAAVKLAVHRAYVPPLRCKYRDEAKPRKYHKGGVARFPGRSHSFNFDHHWVALWYHVWYNINNLHSL